MVEKTLLEWRGIRGHHDAEVALLEGLSNTMTDEVEQSVQREKHLKMMWMPHKNDRPIEGPVMLCGLTGEEETTPSDGRPKVRSREGHWYENDTEEQFVVMEENHQNRLPDWQEDEDARNGEDLANSAGDWLQKGQPREESEWCERIAHKRPERCSPPPLTSVYTNQYEANTQLRL